ncbi:hypothetical protein GCM10009597_01870 [Peribacillus frigoritolerans]
MDESALVSFCSYKSVLRNNKIKNQVYNCVYTLNKEFDVYKARRKEIMQPSSIRIRPYKCIYGYSLTCIFLIDLNGMKLYI